MPRAYALLRAGFPYVKTLGMRRITSNPIDVGIGREARLYVLCRGDLATEIRRTSWDDEDLGTIGGLGRTDGKFVWPAALVVDRDENLYVSDEALHRISCFSADGAFRGAWGEYGTGEGQLNRPSGIAFDADENLYVADTLNHRIQTFTKDGRFLAGWGSFGSGAGEFNMPWGIDVDDEGFVYVADWRNDRIQKFSAAGEHLLSFGASAGGSPNRRALAAFPEWMERGPHADAGDGSAPKGQLHRPSGVTVDRDGDIYVADWGNNRIVLFNPEGRYVQQFLGDATLSRMGRDYVLANALTLRLREMADLEVQKRFKSPVSVRVDDEGRMYVPDYGCHRIQIYQKQADRIGSDGILPPMRSPTLTTA
jgi:DNA-binding beta-propeller fold protein YncE